MILLFVLCVNLSILHLCVSDLGYQCDYDERDDSMKPTIYLIEENKASKYQKTLNSMFIWSCGNYYEIIKDTLLKTNPTDNIINFAVPKYYDGKPMGQMDNFVYAGNISKNIADAACIRKNAKNKGQHEDECHEIANFVSQSVKDIDDGQLYSFVQELTYDLNQEMEYDRIMSRLNHMRIINFNPFWNTFPPGTNMDRCKPLRKESPTNLTKVLLCKRGHNKKPVNIKPLTLIQVDENDCYQYSNSENLLAVLTPKPDKGAPDTLIPTIFYETQYLYSEEMNAFPNSMNLVPWRLLKYGFLKFIEKVGWQRVAIVSDDSEYSVAFEDELAALFNEEKKIVYTVIRCDEAKCNMNKMAQELNRAAARIIIANVEENNLRNLILYLTRMNSRITWLLRDKIDQYLIPDGHVAFAFELRIDTMTTECRVEDNILTSLSSISQAYIKTAPYSSELNKREFYRRFADEVKKATPKITEGVIVVHKLNGWWSEISKMPVTENGATITYYEDPFLNVAKPSDGTANCLVTTYNYYAPCKDELILIFMFTLMAFVTTFALILCYFDNTSPYNDPRYHNF